MKKSQIGMWVWGGVTTALAIFCLAMIFVFAAHIGSPIKSTDGIYDFAPCTNKWIISLYYVLKDHGGLVGAIIGFSGLAWSHFYTSADKSLSNKRSGRQRVRNEEANSEHDGE